jgi:ATP dependent DNA ligase-like protein
LLQAALRSKTTQLIFYAFDLLHLDGGDLREKPLLERRAKLKRLIGGDSKSLRAIPYLQFINYGQWVEMDRPKGRQMPEILFNPDFWKAQWGAIWSAPWVFLPALLIAFAVGWKWKGTNQDAEIRGLRADRDASVSRLD